MKTRSAGASAKIRRQIEIATNRRDAALTKAKNSKSGYAFRSFIASATTYEARRRQLSQRLR